MPGPGMIAKALLEILQKSHTEFEELLFERYKEDVQVTWSEGDGALLLLVTRESFGGGIVAQREYVLKISDT